MITIRRDISNASPCRPAAVALLAMLLIFFIPIRPAFAVCCPPPTECCGNSGDLLDGALDRADELFDEETGASEENDNRTDVEDEDGNIIRTPTGRTPLHFYARFQDYVEWFVNDYFIEYILPAMMRMAEHLSAVGMYQISVLGSLLDGKQQMETQRAFAALAAQAQRDYHPSDFLCTIGSSMRSLAGSERNADVNTLALTERALDRQLLNRNASSTQGQELDLQSRVEQFRTTYCDPNDLDRAMQTVCDGAPQGRRNRDVDFTRLISGPLTLDINFSDNVPTDDEVDVLALGSNLFAHEVFSQIEQSVLDGSVGNKQRYMDLRAIAAKRGVAQHSFNTIAALKSRGASDGAETVTYLQGIMRDLGVTDAAQLETLLGRNPSYYAQMEILTRYIYQSPDFIAGLYDKPANVARRSLATQAFNLMQSHDLYESDLRTEMLLAVLLEMEVSKEQENVERAIRAMTEGRR